MTERKSEIVWVLGFLMVYLPTMAITLSFMWRLSLPAFAVGGAMWIAGAFMLLFAHEHAKSLPPCGYFKKEV
jgi:hypothetical protein